MSDIEALERKTYIEYCLFLERYLEKVEALEAQIQEMKTNSPGSKSGKKRKSN